MIDEFSPRGPGASSGRFTPVMTWDLRPAPGTERWRWSSFLRPLEPLGLELALVVDSAVSMALWRRTVAWFRELLRAHGPFVDVWTWRLCTDAGGEGRQLQAGWEGEEPVRVGRAPREPGEGCLTLVLSDCVSRGWYTGEVARLLERWGHAGPVAVVQVLQKPLWPRTALRQGSVLALQAPRRCATNEELVLKRPAWWPGQGPREGPVVPVFPLEPEALGHWARFLAGEDVTLQGFELHLSGALPPTMEDLAAHPPEAARCVQRFLSTASTPARKLATFLAATPVSLPVMRFVQETLVPEADEGHLAEVFLGGLLRVPSGQGEGLDPETTQYDFWPGVRELLLDSLPTSGARRVLLSVSDFLEGQRGPVRYFPSLLMEPEKDVAVFVALHREFARSAVGVLQRMGGAYARLARGLSRALQKPRVSLCFHSIYHGMRVRLLDAGGRELAAAVVGEQAWSVELLPGAYAVELSDLGLRRPLDVQAPSVFFRWDWAPSGRKVLVVGSGTYRLNRVEKWVAEAMGDLLARAGHTLVSGAWQGVDDVAGRAYRDRLRAAGITDSSTLLQLLPEGRAPSFEGGQLIPLPAGSSVHDELLRRAEAVVLIGGTEGTFTLYQRARKWGRPIVPLVSTGGAAWQAFDQLRAAGDEKVRGQLNLLCEPIGSKEGARILASRAHQYLQSLLSSARPPPVKELELKRCAGELGLDEGVERRLCAWAQEYERIRKHEHPGDKRFGAQKAFIRRIAEELSFTASVSPSRLPAQALAWAFARADLPGRAVLLGLLLAREAPEDFGIVREVLEKGLSAVEQYAALCVAGKLVEQLGPERRTLLLERLVVLLGSNSLQFLSDPDRMELVVKLISRLKQPETPSHERLVRAVHAQSELVRQQVFLELRERLLGRTVRHPSFPSDHGEAVIRELEQFFGFRVDDASLRGERRPGVPEGMGVMLTVEFFVRQARLALRVCEERLRTWDDDDMTVLEAEPSGGCRQVELASVLEVAARVRLEFEPREGDPFGSPCSVFIENIVGIKVVRTEQPEVNWDRVPRTPRGLLVVAALVPSG
ncbi:putative Rossmann-fold nucleotide-binding protein [Archangium gephyra]|uniref:Rossmann-fold nucleotide-binding protein n=1 Tax=Archangium gephyra TaxID=48 RepID=A0AAC8QJ78_9BACT|nr:SAV_2336 N-terminal domain-related protein [Archangium gephyra]AKJ08455.1 putative serine/threonine protein kinase [Archangium gephyra]REG20545.1 putative Rossmann-fold nucleotide-binding protein [Archangium gephyra]